MYECLFTHTVVWFQKTVPCELCKEVLMVVEQVLKDNATEVRFRKPLGELKYQVNQLPANIPGLWKTDVMFYLCDCRQRFLSTWRRPVSCSLRKN